MLVTNLLHYSKQPVIYSILLQPTLHVTSLFVFVEDRNVSYTALDLTAVHAERRRRRGDNRWVQYLVARIGLSWVSN